MDGRKPILSRSRGLGREPAPITSGLLRWNCSKPSRGNKVKKVTFVLPIIAVQPTDPSILARTSLRSAGPTLRTPRQGSDAPQGGEMCGNGAGAKCMRPSRRIEASEGERRRSKTSTQEVSRSSSRRRLTSYKPIAAKGPTRANPPGCLRSAAPDRCGGKSCGAPSHVGPSAGSNHFRLGTCSVARGRRLPCLSNVRRWGASVRRMGKHGTWAAYPRRDCSLPRGALSNRARLAANSRHRGSVIKRRPASCGRATGAFMMRCFDGGWDGAFLRTENPQKFLPTSNNPPVSRSGEAFALTEILIDMAILSGQSARYPGSNCRSAGVGRIPA